MSGDTRPPEDAAPSGGTGPKASGTLFPDAAVSFGGGSPAEGGAATPPGGGGGTDDGAARRADPDPGAGGHAVTGDGVAARGRSAAGPGDAGPGVDGSGARGGGPGVDGSGARDGGPEDRELLGRVFLARVLEPGDEAGGRWVRERGAGEVVRRLREGGRALPGVSEKRWAGLCARAGRADPRRDLAVARSAGARFVVPGTAEWPGQLDDLGDARPLGLWVRGGPSLRMWALRSVAVVGARACTEYGAHMAATLAAGLAERGWVVVSGGAYVLYPVTVVAQARCYSCDGVGIERPVLAAS